MATGRRICRITAEVQQGAGQHEILYKVLPLAAPLKHAWRTCCRQSTAHSLLHTLLYSAQGRQSATQRMPSTAGLVLNNSSCTYTETPALYSVVWHSSVWPAYIPRRNVCCGQASTSARRPLALGYGRCVSPPLATAQKLLACRPLGIAKICLDKLPNETARCCLSTGPVRGTKLSPAGAQPQCTRPSHLLSPGRREALLAQAAKGSRQALPQLWPSGSLLGVADSRAVNLHSGIAMSWFVLIGSSHYNASSHIWVLDSV